MTNNTPLERNSDELADMVLEWYEAQIRQKYYLRDIYNQFVRSATSIGANIAEAKFAQSTADYKSKMNIALKEANESRYWIARLVKNQSINEELKVQLLSRLEAIINMLIAIRNK